MDYSIARFSSSTASTDSDMTALPSTSYPRNKLENSFCSNFKCCGHALENLHDLLQHYEEAHVKFEDDDMPAMIDDENSPSSSATSSQPPSPKAANATADSSSTSSDRSGTQGESLSAFDTTVMRSPMKGKKRSFGQFSNTTSNGQVQSLRRALIDGGIGRGSSRASSIYSANSPFSTPGSSIPGTPNVEGDTDAAFFGTGSNAPVFSSLSLRGNEDHDLPSCAPPNLFFPAAGSNSGSSGAASTSIANSSNQTNSSAPPAKREKMTASLLTGVASALESSLANPNTLGDRPYKCTSPGCDKAYKQMNGLKYHRLHGQCNQNNIPPQQQLSAVVNEKTSNDGSGKATEISGPTTPTGAVGPNGLADSPESTSSPSTSMPGSPKSTHGSINGDGSAANKFERVYICQVGNCGKRYKNLNGLRYHYLHSGSHGMLGLQLLHANGGGASARADATTGRPAISTNDLSTDALKAVAQAAAEQQQLNQRNAMQQLQQKAQQSSDIPELPSTTPNKL